MKAKRFYQTPAIEKAVVELEGGFCASVTYTDDVNGATIATNGQEVTDATADQLDQWNNDSWE